jgi:site-specific recombinase XerD
VTNPTLPSEAMDAVWRYFAPTEAPATDELEALADRFVELKRHLGHKYDTSRVVLRRFLRFLEEHGVYHTGQLSDDVMRQWAESRRHLDPRAFEGELQRIAVFMEHLKAIGKLAENPAEFLKHRVPRNSVPYIFTVEELRRIFVPSRTGRWEETQALIWRFIYACGLRSQEAAHLLIREFDPGARTVFIRLSKFGKDRLLPVHPKIVDRLARYIATHRKDASPDDPLFAGGRGRAYVPASLSRCFKEHLVRLGIYRPNREVHGLRYTSPRLHSLRHSFAVQRLLKWYRDGADVQAKLPLLSTYLGHSAVKYTQVYLTITAVLLREAAGRFAARCEREVPLSP